MVNGLQRLNAANGPYDVNGLPLHALAVHASVVFVPVSVFLGVLFAVPRTRYWSRLPMLVVSIGALTSLVVSRQSGLSLQKTLALTGPAANLINTHRHRANVLIVMMIVFVVLVVLAYVVTRPPATNQTLTNVVAVLLVVGGAAVAYQTYRVGDVGARALWNPTGQVNYGN